MSAIFEMTIPTETLDHDEIVQISGCSRKSDQIDWLTSNGWIYHRNKAGEPVVGRLYARLKMSGINAANLATPGGWTPDFSKVA